MICVKENRDAGTMPMMNTYTNSMNINILDTYNIGHFMELLRRFKVTTPLGLII